MPKKQANKELPSEASFALYERVRRRGLYNMLDPRARILTGLHKEVYASVMDHYGELCEMYPNVADED